MRQILNRISSVRVVFRKTSALTKIVVTAAIVLSMAALLTLHVAINATVAAAENLRFQAMALEQENRRLEYSIENADTVEGVIHIAQEKLGLVEPDSIIIQPE